MSDINTLRAALEGALISLDGITDKVDGTGFNTSDEFSRCLDSIDLSRAALAATAAPEQATLTAQLADMTAERDALTQANAKLAQQLKYAIADADRYANA